MLVLLTLTALAAFAYTRIYDQGKTLMLLMGAAAGSVLLSTLLRPLPGWLAGPVSVLGLTGYTVLAVNMTLTAENEGTLFQVYADAARNALPRLLTAAVPVEATPDTIFAPIVAIWVAGLAGAEIGGRGGRLLFGALPPTLAYAGALVLAGPNARPALWLSMTFAAVCAVGLALSARQGAASTVEAPPQPRDRAFQLRAFGGAAAGLAAMVAVAVAAGPIVFDHVGRTPKDPRSEVTPPRKDVLDENPLIRLSGWAANPKQHLFDADLSADAPIRLAVLNEYDGVTWKLSADYRNAGRVLPSAEGPVATGKQTTVKQTYTVSGLGGSLVPAVGVPRRVDNLRVAFDTNTGTLFKSGGLPASQKYQVESLRTQPDVNTLTLASVPTGPEAEKYLTVAPSIQKELVDLANSIGKDAISPHSKALTLQAFLAEHYTFATDAPTGHSQVHLKFFLLDEPKMGGRRGTSEQFAASFALLGRMMGLPTRVVVGFKGKAGAHPVLAGQAMAWPEVWFDGHGWVSFDPMPVNAKARPLEEDYTPPPTTKPSVTPSTVTSSPIPSSSGALPGAVTPIGKAAEDPHLGRTLAIAGAILVLCALLSVVLLRRSRHRSRLGSGSPAERIGGSWVEIRDALRLAGYPPPAHLTASEVAQWAGLVYGRGRYAAWVELPSLDQAASMVNLVAFAPGMATADDAGLATGEARAYIKALRARRPLWRRLVWTLDPRPLFWKTTLPVSAEQAAPRHRQPAS